MVELTVPWEEGMEAAFERTKEKYTAGSRVLTSRAESVHLPSGSRLQRLRWNIHSAVPLRITGSKLRQALKDLTEEAEQGSFRLCL